MNIKGQKENRKNLWKNLNFKKKRQLFNSLKYWKKKRVKKKILFFIARVKYLQMFIKKNFFQKRVDKWRGWVYNNIRNKK